MRIAGLLCCADNVTTPKMADCDPHPNMPFQKAVRTSSVNTMTDAKHDDASVLKYDRETQRVRHGCVNAVEDVDREGVTDVPEADAASLTRDPFGLKDGPASLDGSRSQRDVQVKCILWQAEGKLV